MAVEGETHFAEEEEQRDSSKGGEFQEVEKADPSSLPAHVPKKRRICCDCQRPLSVCVCGVVEGKGVSLASPAVNCLVSRVLVFSHPLEGKRKNNSVRLLQLLVPDLEIWSHRKPGCCPFNSKEQASRNGKPAARQHGVLAADDRPCESTVSDTKRTHLSSPEGVACVDTSSFILVFPRDDALPLGVAPLALRLPATVLVLDGTWKEAREMLKAAPWLADVQAVKIFSPDFAPLPSGLDNASSKEEVKWRTETPQRQKGERRECVRLSGTYSRVRTPPEREAAAGGVCTAESLAEVLSFLGRYGRTSDPCLLNLASNTRALLRRVVEMNESRRCSKAPSE